MAWRLMAATNSVRTMHATLIPPGAAHVNGVISASKSGLGFGDLLVIAASLASLPIDFMVKAANMGHFYGSVVETLPIVRNAY